MSAVATDTHALVWYITDPPRLSAKAVVAFKQAATSGDPIYVASISLVEICYLVEKGRMPADVLQRLIAALDADAALVVAPLDLEIAQAVSQIARDLVPDMPDRIIAATALHLKVPLVTRDAKIQLAQIVTIW